MTLNGAVVRFCQQCGRFQPLVDFDGSRRSCRHKLQMHNAQRKRVRDAARAAAATAAAAAAAAAAPSHPPAGTSRPLERTPRSLELTPRSLERTPRSLQRTPRSLGRTPRSQASHLPPSSDSDGPTPLRLLVPTPRPTLPRLRIPLRRPVSIDYISSAPGSAAGAAALGPDAPGGASHSRQIAAELCLDDIDLDAALDALESDPLLAPAQPLALGAPPRTFAPATLVALGPLLPPTETYRILHVPETLHPQFCPMSVAPGAPDVVNGVGLWAPTQGPSQALLHLQAPFLEHLNPF